MKKFTLILGALFTVVTLKINAQNLIPDTLFGSNATMQIATVHDELSGQFLLQPDGKILFCGHDYDGVANDFHMNLTRFDQCGEMDLTFGTNGYVRHNFDFRNLGFDFELQPDGKILCAGMQANSNAASAQKSCIMRYNADGTPDSTFNLTGANALYYPGSVVGEFHSVARMPNGRILGMGNFGQFNGPGVMRFLADGSLDLSFDGDGQAFYTNPSVNLVGRATGYLRQNGNMVFTASGFDSGSNGHFYTCQLDSNGVVDPSYGAGGFYLDNTLPLYVNFISLATAMDVNEKIIMAGNINASGIDILRLKTSGVPDSTFGVNGYVNYAITGTTVKSMSVMANGNILLKGEYAVGFGIGFGIMLLPDGTPDTQFGANGFRTFDLNNNSGTHWLNDLLELPNGKWLVGATQEDFIFRKYSNQSNVPHISQTGDSLFTTGGLTFQWFRNDTLISAATDNNLPLTQNGTYMVFVTDDQGCTYLSDSLLVTNVVIIDLITDIVFSSVNLFPNPVSTELFIETKNGFTINEIKITDVDGRVVKHEIINNKIEQYTISVSELNSGVYFVTIISDQQEKWMKLIKN